MSKRPTSKATVSDSSDEGDQEEASDKPLNMLVIQAKGKAKQILLRCFLSSFKVNIPCCIGIVASHRLNLKKARKQRNLQSQAPQKETEKKTILVLR